MHFRINFYLLTNDSSQIIYTNASDLFNKRNYYNPNKLFCKPSCLTSLVYLKYKKKRAKDTFYRKT